MRHIEIDITSGYFEAVEGHLPKITDIFVCHSPIPLDPKTIAEVNEKVDDSNSISACSRKMYSAKEEEEGSLIINSLDSFFFTSGVGQGS